MGMSEQLSDSRSANSSGPANAGHHQHAGIKSFVLSRWRGEAPLPTLFWRDMIIIGTALNAVAFLTAVLLLAFEVPTAIAVLVFFAPLPWNLFLFFSVWRSTNISKEPGAMLMKAGAAVWLVLVTAI